MEGTVSLAQTSTSSDHDPKAHQRQSLKNIIHMKRIFVFAQNVRANTYSTLPTSGLVHFFLVLALPASTTVFSRESSHVIKAVKKEVDVAEPWLLRMAIAARTPELLLYGRG